MSLFFALRHSRSCLRISATVLLAYWMLSSAAADDWRHQFPRELGACESIPADAYETGLLFNPAGRRTYFERSRCLQRVAIEWREAGLCAQVKQRRSPFFSGHAVSENACREAVAERMAEDETRAESIRVEDLHRLVGAHLERPHYLGGDFLLRIETEGSHPGSYQIRITTWSSATSASFLIDDYRQPLGSNGHSLTRTIRQRQIHEALRNQSTDREVRVRIILELPPRSHSDQFVLAQLPIENRRSTFDMQFDFPKL